MKPSRCSNTNQMCFHHANISRSETVLEELLRAMSAEEAVVAARDVSAAISAGCDIDDTDKRSSALEDVVSLLQLLEDFAA